MMFKVIATLSFILAVVTATSDPYADLCWGKCREHDALEARCIEEKGCYPWDDETTIPCLEPCWKLSAPCRVACRESIDNCRKDCGDAGSDTDYYDCFNSCHVEGFVEPSIPEESA